jgi:hypothetical protein
MNLVGLSEFRQFSERSGKNGLVARPIIWRPKGTADRMVDEGGAGRGDLAHYVVGRANNQRGNALAFNNMSDETDGLMAEGSIGNEQGEIDLQLL